MTETITRSMWRKLYKQLFREARKFSDYNYREYAKRRVRDYFRDNAHEQNQVKLQSLYDFGQRELTSLKRQTTLGGLYSAPKLIIENLSLGEQLSQELEKIGKKL